MWLGLLDERREVSRLLLGSWSIRAESSMLADMVEILAEASLANLTTPFRDVVGMIVAYLCRK